MKNYLKKKWTGLSADLKAVSPHRSSNLKCSYIDSKPSDSNTLPFVLPVKNYVQAKHFADAVAVIDSYIHKRVFTVDGKPLYSVAARELENVFRGDTDSITANEQLLAHYANWHASRPDCPYAAAAYAGALQTTGHSHRGTQWANKVKPEQWQAMLDYNNKAQAVFNATRNEFQNHWYWAKNYLHFSLTSNVEKQEIWRRFERCVTSNPYDYQIYDIMAYMMLPRWHGSFQDVEKVAARAVDVTKVHCAEMMYAVTLSSVFEFHYLKELTFDWERLKAGFSDWLRLFPSDYVKTQFACSAYVMEEYALTLTLLESLDTFYGEAWDADDDLNSANSFCQEFIKNYPHK